VREAQKLGIPVVAIVDTNNSVDGIDYVIPGNDDAIGAIKLYSVAAADAVLDGKQSAQLQRITEVSTESEENKGKGAAKKVVSKKAGAKLADKKPESAPDATADDQNTVAADDNAGESTDKSATAAGKAVPRKKAEASEKKDGDKEESSNE
jgi:small subunit ribosomal protein S2